MKRIQINGYPLDSEIVSGGQNLLNCLAVVNCNWEIKIKWNFDNNGKLNVCFVVDSNELQVLNSIVCYLNLNKYQYMIDEVTGMEEPDQKKSVNFKICSQSFTNDGIFSKSSLFHIISFLKQEKCELLFKVKKTCNNGNVSYFYNIICSYRFNNSIKPIPLPIITNYKLLYTGRLMPGNGAPKQIESVQSLLPLFSLPIAYDGIKNLLYGYGDNSLVIIDPEEIENKNDIVVGKICNHFLDEYLTLKPKAFSYMTSVWGVPGSGKTVLSLSLVAQLWNKFKIPSLIIEPSKHEYRALANVLNDGVKVLRDLRKINILIPPEGVDVYAWSEVIVTLINMSCQLPDDSSLSGYYRNAYISAATQKEQMLTPVLMINWFEHILKLENFAGKQAQDFIKAGKSRLEAFFNYFNGSKNNWYVSPEKLQLKPLNIKELFDSPVVIELASITTPKLKSAFVYFFLQHIYAYIQQRHSEADKLGNLLLLEEAHNILRTTSNQEVLNNVSNILAEARALQMGVLISDQSPKTLDPSCVSMAQNVFSFKIVNQEDREIITHATNGNIERLLDLTRGVCLTRTHFMFNAEYVNVTISEKFKEKISIDADENKITYLYN